MDGSATTLRSRAATEPDVMARIAAAATSERACIDGRLRVPAVRQGLTIDEFGWKRKRPTNHNFIETIR
jgi:hypothetical protein